MDECRGAQKECPDALSQWRRPSAPSSARARPPGPAPPARCDTSSGQAELLR